MELKEQLKDEQACIDHHRQRHLEAQGRFDKIKAQIAEAEKPKRPTLQHLDWGMDKAGHFFIAIRDYESRALFISGTGSLPRREACNMPRMDSYIILGNLKDYSGHLAAMQEDLAELDLDCNGKNNNSHVRCFREMDNCFSIRTSTGVSAGVWAWMTMDDLAKLICDLQRMEATQKRKANG